MPTDLPDIVTYRLDELKEDVSAVRSEIQTLRSELQAFQGTLTRVLEEQAAMRVKAGMWGGVSGLIAGAGSVLAYVALKLSSH